MHSLTHLHASCLCRPHCLDHCLHQVLGIFHKHHVSLEWKTIVCCMLMPVVEGNIIIILWWPGMLHVQLVHVNIFCRDPGAGESYFGAGEAGASYPGADSMGPI